TASYWQQITPIGAKAASSVIALLEGRSPGERAEGRLVKAKATLGENGRQLLIPPEERILGKVFPPPASEGDLGNPEELLTLILPPEDFGIVLEELPEGLQTASLGGPSGGAPAGVPVYWGGGGGAG